MQEQKNNSDNNERKLFGDLTYSELLLEIESVIDPYAKIE